MNLKLSTFRNQYLISDTTIISKVKGFESSKIFGFDVKVFPPLEITVFNHKNSSVLLIGIALDPYNPLHSNVEIAERLAQNSSDLSAFFKQLMTLSGRFVILYKNKKDFIAVGDACHFRQIYYGFVDDNIVLTSSPKLFLEYFDLELKSNPLKTNFVNSAEFARSENSWFGDASPDDRLKKLLPNFYLDIHTGEALRIKYDGVRNSSDNEIIEYSYRLLRGTYQALLHRDYKLVQPLTAGWDSRVLFAASKEIKKSINYYVFTNREKSQKKDQDVRISSNLAKKLDINFQVIYLDELEEGFINRFKKNHIYHRILSKTKNIQFHFNQKGKDYTVNINGNGAEILRCFYGNYSGEATFKMLIYFSGFPNNKFVVKELYSWYSSAKRYAKEIGFNILDLFYWEQRMGNWGALFPYEQDMAIEEISPFNNRSLLHMMYSAGYKNRRKPDHKIFNALITHLWSETLSEKINPDVPKIKSLVKRYTYSRYYALVINNICRKLITKR